MKCITLSPEQAQVVLGAREPVRILCPDGSIAGWVSSTMHYPPAGRGIDPETVAAALRESESDGPFYSTQDVMDSLRSPERS